MKELGSRHPKFERYGKRLSLAPNYNKHSWMNALIQKSSDVPKCITETVSSCVKDKTTPKETKMLQKGVEN